MLGKKLLSLKSVLPRSRSLSIKNLVAEGAIAFGKEVERAKKTHSHTWQNPNGYPGHVGGINHPNEAYMKFSCRLYESKEGFRGNYGSSLGDSDTRELLAQFYNQLIESPLSTEEMTDSIIVTGSAKNILGTIISTSQGTLHHPNPVYPIVPYFAQKNQNLTTSHYSIHNGEIDIKKLEESISSDSSSKSHTIYLNTLGNPTPEKLINLPELIDTTTNLSTKGYNIHLVSDETYALFNHETSSSKHFSFWVKDLNEQQKEWVWKYSTQIFSAKLLGAPGERTSFAKTCTPRKNTLEDSAIANYSNPPRNQAFALANTLTTAPGLQGIFELNQMLKTVHDTFKPELENALGFKIAPSAGPPFFAIPHKDAKALILKTGFQSAEHFRDTLLNETGISINIGKEFNYNKPFFRITYGVLSLKDCKEAASILKKWIIKKELQTKFTDNTLSTVDQNIAIVHGASGNVGGYLVHALQQPNKDVLVTTNYDRATYNEKSLHQANVSLEVLSAARKTCPEQKLTHYIAKKRGEDTQSLLETLIKSGALQDGDILICAQNGIDSADIVRETLKKERKFANTVVAQQLLFTGMNINENGERVTTFDNKNIIFGQTVAGKDAVDILQNHLSLFQSPKEKHVLPYADGKCEAILKRVNNNRNLADAISYIENFIANNGTSSYSHENPLTYVRGSQNNTGNSVASKLTIELFNALKPELNSHKRTIKNHATAQIRRMLHSKHSDKCIALIDADKIDKAIKHLQSLTSQQDSVKEIIQSLKRCQRGIDFYQKSQFKYAQTNHTSSTIKSIMDHKIPENLGGVTNITPLTSQVYDLLHLLHLAQSCPEDQKEDRLATLKEAFENFNNNIIIKPAYA